MCAFVLDTKLTYLIILFQVILSENLTNFYKIDEIIAKDWFPS